MASPSVAEPEQGWKIGTCHSLSHGSLCSIKGLGCNRKIADNGHDLKKILSNDVDRCHWW